MRAPARLGLYGGILVVVFGLAGLVANAVVPDGVAQSWSEGTPDGSAEHDMNAMGAPERAGLTTSPGLGLSQDGYRLAGVTAPTTIGGEGPLALTIIGPDGNQVTGFDVENEKELHLVVVRSDGQYFRHVHPRRDADGVWSVLWRWEAAGSYRVFADFVPSETGEGLTLSTSAQVAGDYTPAPPGGPFTETTVDGYDVAVAGDLVAGESAELTMTITRDGRPVTGIEPYLGAFGHLVALREGDLAFLHAHPRTQASSSGTTSGPRIAFETTAPTEGRYLLYLDFQVDGQVRTASLVLDAAAPSSGTGESESERQEGQEGQ